MKKKLLPFIQLAVGVGLMAFIFHKLKQSGDLTRLVTAFRGVADNWEYLCVALLVIGICFILCIIRWKLLLDAQGMTLTFWQVGSLFLVGHFFNAFMFGATGGDLVKAYYVARETSHKRTEAVSTVFIDRMVGLLALVVLTLVITFVRLPFFLEYRETRIAMLFNFALFAATCIGLLAVFGQNFLARIPLFRRLQEHSSFGQTVGRSYNAFRFCLGHRALLAKTMALSSLNHLSMVAVVFYLGLALGLPLGYMSYLTIVPTINTFAAIPLTPGGLGTRESASLFLFGVLGVASAEAVSLSLLQYAVILVWSIVGGVVYLIHAARWGKI